MLHVFNTVKPTVCHWTYVDIQSFQTDFLSASYFMPHTLKHEEMYSMNTPYTPSTLLWFRGQSPYISEGSWLAGMDIVSLMCSACTQQGVRNHAATWSWCYRPPPGCVAYILWHQHVYSLG